MYNGINAAYMNFALGATDYTTLAEEVLVACQLKSPVARVLGRERVIAGADGGFAQGALYQRQHPSVMWAKFEALVQGARLASERLGRP
jgi:5-methyltetrahydropteroyltriglutamate--homocysteine methyltransferase